MHDNLHRQERAGARGTLCYLRVDSAGATSSDKKLLTLFASRALLALAAICLLPAALGQTALVSNLGQTAGTDASGSASRAQRFTTGSHPHGYVLDRIEIVTSDTEGDSFLLSVFTVDASGSPQTLVTTLAPPSSFAAGTLSFAAPAGTKLKTGTTYAAVIDSGGATLALGTTAADAEDAGAAAGWSLENAFDVSSGADSWAAQASGEALRIAVKASPAPESPQPPEGTQAVPQNWGLIPSDLVLGDTFRLLFATSGTRNARSTAIADYNTFAQNAAAGGHSEIQTYSTQFKAVGSTRSVDARDNTATTYTDADKGVRIYWLGGNKVADDYEDFYDGNWDDETGSTDESGSARDLSGSNEPFTGSRHDGTRMVHDYRDGSFWYSELGASDSYVQLGTPGDSDDGRSGPLSYGVPGNEGLNDIHFGNARPFYAPSPVFWVARVVRPGPNTLTSNVSRAGGTAAAGTERRSQAFTTGAHLGGYGLSSVEVLSEDTEGDSFSVSVYTTDASGHPENLVTTLAPPESSDAGTLAFASPAGIALDPGTTYAVVVEPAGGTLTLGTTAEDGEDAGGIAGWSIADAFHSSSSGGSWQADADSRALRIAIKGNSRPAFAESVATALSVPENSAPGTAIGGPLGATDADGHRLAYTLEGSGKEAFEIESASGQIRARDALDHEARSSYSVTVRASDGADSATIDVTIGVTDVSEPPLAPRAVRVRSSPRSPTSLTAQWRPSENAGKPDIESYDVQYREAGMDRWSDGPQDLAADARRATITGLTTGTEYEVSVRATNHEGDGEWSSPPGRGTPMAYTFVIVGG